MNRVILLLATVLVLLLAASCSSTNDAQSQLQELVLARITAEAGEPTNLVAALRTGKDLSFQATEEDTGASVTVTASYPHGIIIVDGAVSATYADSHMTQPQTSGVGSFPVFRKVTYRVTSGGFAVGSSLALISQEGKWDGKKERAVHRLEGKMTLFGYEFDSSANNPLTFRVTRNGYKYLHGSGTVKDTENGRVYEVNDSSTTGKLIEAVGSGDLDTVKKLLATKVNVNSKQPYGDTCLIVACKRGNMDMAHFLINKGADVNLTDGVWGRTPLMEAISQENWALALFLLKRGADPNLKDRQEKAPLIVAAEKCELEFVRACLDSRNIEVNISNADGKTPVHVSLERDTLAPQVRKACRDVARLLLEKGASANSSDKDGCTSLMRASRNDYPEIVTLLLQKGADINATDRHGGTALMAACDKGRSEAVEILLEYGADLSLRAKNGVTALQISNARGWAKISEILRQKGAQ